MLENSEKKRYLEKRSAQIRKTRPYQLLPGPSAPDHCSSWLQTLASSRILSNLTPKSHLPKTASEKPYATATMRALLKPPREGDSAMTYPSSRRWKREGGRYRRSGKKMAMGILPRGKKILIDWIYSNRNPSTSFCNVFIHPSYFHSRITVVHS